MLAQPAMGLLGCDWTFLITIIKVFFVFVLNLMMMSKHFQTFPFRIDGLVMTQMFLC
jgi:hypothetical protein